MLGTKQKVAVLLRGVLLAAAAAFPAHADEAKPTVETTEIRTIVRDGPALPGATFKDGQEMKIDCPGEVTVIEATVGSAPEKQEKAKMVFCSKSGDKADAVAGLEKALARVEGDRDMNDALRADVSAKLRARIAELRTGN